MAAGLQSLTDPCGNALGLVLELKFLQICPECLQHRVTSRAFDSDGNVQPALDDPLLASKRTFWESNGHITRQVLIP